MEGVEFYMEGDRRVGLVLVMHELKPVLVFGGRKKIDGGRDRLVGGNRWKGERTKRTNDLRTQTLGVQMGGGSHSASLLIV